MTVKCFLVVSKGVSRVFLRRYVLGDSAACNSKMGFHNALSEPVDRVPLTVACEGIPLTTYPEIDSRWPTRCECGYEFQAQDPRQVFTDEIYTCDGKEYSLRDNTPGMMYDATYLHDHKEFCGPDGKSIHVVCPDGRHWCIDSRANNCTMPKDKKHKCWIRHGELPNLTVDKNGNTCSAGGGSIQTKNYHGFLRNGIFT
jgi:hypothetical protein